MKMKSKLILGMLGLVCLFNIKTSAMRSGMMDFPAENPDNSRIFKYSKVRRFENFGSAANFIRTHYQNIIENGCALKGIRINGRKCIEAEIIPVGPGKGETTTKFEVVTSHYIQN